jgi:elongation of very long chain fatty acids protein 7
VSALHVVHHSIMPVSTWFGVKFCAGDEISFRSFFNFKNFVAGGHASFFVLLNSFVHIIMYSYYFLSAWGPHLQKYLWWKKYLTSLQILQFLSVTVHSLLSLLTDCDVPQGQLWFILSHAVLFLGLFSIFYKETYKKKQLVVKKE